MPFYHVTAPVRVIQDKMNTKQNHAYHSTAPVYTGQNEHKTKIDHHATLN